MLISFLECEILLAFDPFALFLDHFDVALLPVENSLVREGAFVETEVSHVIGVNEDLASRAFGLALLPCDLKRSEALHDIYMLVVVLTLRVGAGALHVETLSDSTTNWCIRVHVKVNSFFQIVEDQRFRWAAPAKCQCQMEC